MSRRGRTFFSLFICLAASARFQCDWKMPFSAENRPKTPAVEIPLADKALRAVDFTLMEPGYAHARELSRSWQSYTSAFATDEKRAKELEILANEPAITGLLNDPDGAMAPVFRAEARRVLDEFGNRALIAWRLRALNGKVILGHQEGRLRSAAEAEARREITPRYFTIPIQGTGFNFSLDAEWDISRLSDFPLSQVNSEYLFFQTDHNLNLIALPDGSRLPDTAYRFVSDRKFIAEPHGVQHGMRVVAVKSQDHFLIICYPFAGYLFYAVRGGLIILLLVALVFAVAKLRSLRSAAKHVLENRSGQWLEQHYEQSLSLTEKAVSITDKSLAVTEQLKQRETEVIAELGRQLGNMNRSIAEQTRQLIDETLQAKEPPKPVPGSQAAQPQTIIRPLHKKAVRKEAIILEGDVNPEIRVSIELDLPLTDEKQLPPEGKAALVSSLKRKAREKSALPDFIHDERIDNYDYVPPEPMPLPVVTPAAEMQSEPDTANLEYVQKFRYAGKTRVLPMAAVPAKNPVLNVREDLHREQLIVSEDE